MLKNSVYVVYFLVLGHALCCQMGLYLLGQMPFSSFVIFSFEKSHVFFCVLDYRQKLTKIDNVNGNR